MLPLETGGPPLGHPKYALATVLRDDLPQPCWLGFYFVNSYILDASECSKGTNPLICTQHPVSGHQEVCSVGMVELVELWGHAPKTFARFGLISQAPTIHCHLVRKFYIQIDFFQAGIHPVIKCKSCSGVHPAPCKPAMPLLTLG